MILRRALTAAVFGCVIVLVATSIALAWWAHEQASDRRREQIEACQRGNAIRAELNTIVRILDLGLPALPTIDCPNVID